jgi:predicted RNase H-like nuclease (RuvC/YqgF family)
MSDLMRQFTATPTVEELEAENDRLTARNAELEAAIGKALPVAAELDCMLASGAKSNRAYNKMQDKAEYLRSALAAQEKDDD